MKIDILGGSISKTGGKMNTLRGNSERSSRMQKIENQVCHSRLSPIFFYLSFSNSFINPFFEYGFHFGTSFFLFPNSKVRVKQLLLLVGPASSL